MIYAAIVMPIPDANMMGQQMSSQVPGFDGCLERARGRLLQARSPEGHWEGKLSSSALSTATAVFALHSVLKAGVQVSNRDEIQGCIERGIQWLVEHQNDDGGWGDTTLSFSNISTTALCWAALSFEANLREEVAKASKRAEVWLTQRAGGMDAASLASAIIARYGKDKTFSVPILTMCALAGRLSSQKLSGWEWVPQLPFELAAFPQRWFKWLRLPVVSYALPALIAIGLVRHRRLPTKNPATRWLRRLARARALRLVAQIQPNSGGFLEATPLTSFVLMSLIGAGQTNHPVVEKAIQFLLRSAQRDGSWPIDTNLATWVTTLSINALATNPAFAALLAGDARNRLINWLLDQQYRVEHPYTLANPGAWAWTDLTGGVPDADDTPGALLALHALDPASPRVREAAIAGVGWLLDLQNRDGGIPTFCRGWGKLPFDRSSCDLTAHTIRAWLAWLHVLPDKLACRVTHAIHRAVDYLSRQQRPDGAWVPLWFGNQHVPGDENPLYGTSRVLKMIEPLDKWRQMEPAALARLAKNGAAYLLAAQNPDGGWGGAASAPSSIEETSLAIEALSGLPNDYCHQMEVQKSIDRGIARLISATMSGSLFPPSPIGFYFAKLWYFEELYPLIFATGALEAVAAKGNH